MLFTLNIVLVLLVMAMTLLPLCRYPAWWIRDLDFPRLQITLFSLFLLLEQIALMDLQPWHSKLLFGINFGCLLYQALWILPYTRIYPNEVKMGPHPEVKQAIRIMAANVLATNRNAPALIALVHQYKPDLLVTLESNQWWEEQLSILEKDYPFTIKCPLENLYGMHVYSKLPLEDYETQFLVQPGIPSMHTLVVLPSNKRIRMHFLHPAPPSPTENEESSERDAELLIVAKSVSRLDTPVIVAGDLNDVAWSKTTRLFRKISGLLDPRIGRGMFNTFHAGHWFMRWPLDHFFHSRHFTLSFIKRLPAFGSDHFPVLIELLYDEGNGKQQKGLTPHADDKQFAEEKIRAEGVTASDVHEPRN